MNVPGVLRPILHGLAELPRQVLLGLVRGYRFFLKPWLGNACRFEPTCSQYALDALQRHGALAGSALTAGRLLRCHPWCQGGCDPVPDRPPALFRHLGLTAASGDPLPATPDENATPGSGDRRRGVTPNPSVSREPLP